MVDQTTVYLQAIDAKTLEIVEHTGRDPACADGCRVDGKKYPPDWCEKVYQSIRLSMSR